MTANASEFLSKHVGLLARLMAVALLLGLFVSVNVSQTQNPDVNLIDGYKFRTTETLGVLSGAGEIFNNDGFVLSFEEGLSQGYAADKTKIKKYSWFRVQRVADRTFFIAFVKDEKLTSSSITRGKRNEYGTLVVTHPLSDQPHHAINFRARIASEQELIDALLMILSYRSQ
jgi:hypothetical protein